MHDPSEKLKQITESAAFEEGRRAEEYADNPYPKKDDLTTSDPHVQFALGQRWDGHQEGNLSHAVISRHKVGKDRWFWIAAGSFTLLYAALTHGVDLAYHGEAPTSEQAEEAAQAVCPNAEFNKHGRAQTARQYWEMLKTKERMRESTEADSEEAQRLTFVYAVGHGYSGTFAPKKHRIIKRTAKRIYVSQERWSTERSLLKGKSWYKHKVKMYALDRATLEAGEPVKRGSGSLRYYWWLRHEDAHEDAHGAAVSYVPACLAVLGLDEAATPDDVRAAYRRLSKERHPDAGGTEAAFVELQQAYEQALQLVIA